MPAETLTRTSPDATAASPVVPYGDYAPDAYAQRTYTPSEQRTAVLDPADTAPPLRYDQPATRPPLAEDVHAPIAPRLQYNGAQKERLRTHGPGYEEGMTPQQAREAWDADPSTVVLNSYQPLLSKEQVAEQLGTAFANLGALQGVIHLPHAEEPLYVFNRSTIEVGADGKENHVPRFVLATPTQLGKILTNAEIGRPSKQEIRDELLVLSRPLHGGGRQRATIGTDEWLPGRPYGPRS
ncbi:MAG TPA: hypothetical protein VLF71_01710, partial [Candidatus Saccharimonadales bacterium]|nr:hypothetical protein [Candidatus Saccharimonadales bacterium]